MDEFFRDNRDAIRAVTIILNIFVFVVILIRLGLRRKK